MAKVTLTVELTKDELNAGAIALARGVALKSVANADSVNNATCQPVSFTPTGGTFAFDLTPGEAPPAGANAGADQPAAAAK